MFHDNGVAGCDEQRMGPEHRTSVPRASQTRSSADPVLLSGGVRPLASNEVHAGPSSPQRCCLARCKHRAIEAYPPGEVVGWWCGPLANVGYGTRRVREGEINAIQGVRKSKSKRGNDAIRERSRGTGPVAARATSGRLVRQCGGDASSQAGQATSQPIPSPSRRLTALLASI